MIAPGTVGSGPNTRTRFERTKTLLMSLRLLALSLAGTMAACSITNAGEANVRQPPRREVASAQVAGLRLCLTAARYALLISWEPS